MPIESNVILITNDDNVAKILKPKLVLLREIDNISTATYSKAIEVIKSYIPDTILLYCAKEKDECLELIKKIKSDEIIKSTTILLVVKEYDQDFILSAYDENITDYLTLTTDDAEILMRTIWCMKKNSLVNTVQKQHNLLEKLNVINKETDFYSAKYSDAVMSGEFKILEEKNIDAVLMAISTSEEGKVKLNANQIAKAIKNSTRNSDIIAHGTSNKFYLLLPKTNLKGAFCVWDKIKRSVGEDYLLNAGVCQVEGKTFEELKTELLNALVKAEATKQDMVIISDEPEVPTGDWLDKINSSQKNFKLFKQAFSKKLDKVITPVFFQMQKLWEEKLFKTKIEQYSNSTLSSFSLKSMTTESELKITYPGFSKINIDIVHQGLDSPENKRISLDLTELDEGRLTKILEDFINEFKVSTAGGKN